MFLKKQKFIKILLGFLSLVLLFNIFSVLPVGAQELDLGTSYGEQTGLGGGDIRTTIAQIIRVALSLLGIVAVAIVLYGGFVYMTAGGNDEKVATGKKILINGVVGLVIILSSYAIVSFVISKLLDATGTYPAHCFNDKIETELGESDWYQGIVGGQACSEDGKPCRSCSGPNPRLPEYSFYMRSVPGGGQKCVSNLKLSIDFNKDIDFSTLKDGDDWKIKILEGGDVAEEAEGNWVCGDSGNDCTEIIFEPSEACAVGCTASGCLNPDTNYTLKFPGHATGVINSIKSIDDLPLDCNSSRLRNACDDIEFITGSACDTENPVVEITFPTDKDPLETRTNTPVIVSSTDDTGVDKIKLYVVGETYPVDIVSLSGCQTSTEQTLTWKTSGVGDYTLRAWSFDQTHDNKSYDDQIVKVSPTHCFNQFCDEGEDCKKREDVPPVDCGGECRSCSGSSCESDLDCFSGYCDCGVRDGDGECIREGVCRDKTKITNVNPLKGALGTFVSVSGYYFGDKVGDIYFASTTDPTDDDWEKASLADCGENVDAWSKWQVIVASPLIDGQTGPIKIIATSTGNNIPEEHRIDYTNNDWGLPIPDFEATDEERPGLCPIVPPTGTQKMPLDLKGIGFGDERDDSNEDYVYFGDPSDNGTGKAKVRRIEGNPTWGNGFIWNDGFIQVEVPGIDKGRVGVQVFNKNISSNVVSFRMIEEIDKSLPWIESLDPYEGAPGDYITITGKNFGSSQNIVWFEGDNTGKLLKGSFKFPTECQGNVWNDRQIIVKFPEGGTIGENYLVKVERGSDGEKNQLGVYFDLNKKIPRPGICKIDPETAPVPFVSDQKMVIVGERLIEAIDSTVEEGASVFNFNGENTDEYQYVVHGDPIFKDGKVEFNGVDDYLSISDDKFQKLDGITIEVIVTPNAVPLDETSKSQALLGNMVYSRGYSLLIDNDGGGRCPYWRLGINSTFTEYHANSCVKAGKPQQLIGVYGRGENKTFRFYVDGVKVSDADHKSRAMESIHDLIIGWMDQSDDNYDYFNGSVDKITIYDQALSKEQVEYLFAKVYFWQTGASPTSVDDRLPVTEMFNLEFLSVGERLTGIIAPTVTSTRDGSILVKTGPVIVKRGFDNEISNPINFEVMDCKAKLDGEEVGCNQTDYQCCEILDKDKNGTGKGSCYPSNYPCEGQLRKSGYMWRFSTKDIPPVPRVVENCDKDVDFPTPAPSILWNEKFTKKYPLEVCKQALVTVEFNMAMATSTLIDDNIFVKKCIGDANVASTTCYTYSDDVITMQDENKKTGDSILNHFATDITTDVTVGLSLSPVIPWATSTWYQVVLTQGIMSAGYGIDYTVDNKSPLLATRGCGEVTNADGGTASTAYCFLFKTGDEDCKLSGIAVLPYDYWTKILEVPIKHRSIGREYDLFWKGVGKTQQKCINMDVEGYDWEWAVKYKTVTTTPLDFNAITVEDKSYDETTDPKESELEYSNIHYKQPNAKILGIKNKREVDARGHTVGGLVNFNTPQGGENNYVDNVYEINYVDHVYVYAKASTSTSNGQETEDHEDFSPLKIGAGDPEIVAFWPDCLEACTNAVVGVRFNTTMSNENLNPFQLGVYKIEECVDENCFATISPATTEDGVGILEQHQFEALSNYTVLKIANYNNNYIDLKPNTLYKVTVSATSTEVDLESHKDILYSASKFNDAYSKAKPYNKEFTWRFRTKSNNCLVDRVEVDPATYIARSLTDKTIYVAQPYSEPDSCSSKGQKLNPWDNDWDWSSSNTDVATTTQYTIKYSSDYCTDKCILKGSDVPADFAGVVLPICGNGVIEAGEDCDVPNKSLGCSLNCLNTGEIDYTLLGGSCGDRTVNTTSTEMLVNGELKTLIYGEECDYTHTSSSIRHGCSQNCLKEGSKIVTEAENVEGSICGNGMLGAGEECELGISASSTDPTSSYGCTQNCLHGGTRLSSSWCFENGTSTPNEFGGFFEWEYANACSVSYSQCGDGIESPDEDVGCDIGGWNESECNEFCLKKISDCNSGEEGCNRNGRLEGSGLRYSEPSICGDGVQGTGEYADCEENLLYRTSEFDVKVSPWALATAQGANTNVDSNDRIQYASSSIRAEATGDNVKNHSKTGSGEFLIPCGFNSDAECQAYFGPDEEDPKYGVGWNSCCFARPNLIKKYPLEGARDVCPNTVIKATFDQMIDKDTLYENVILAYGLTQNDLDTIKRDEPVLKNTPDIKTKLLSSVDIEGDYLYTISSVDDHSVEIYNISDKEYPIVESTYTSSTVYTDMFVKNGYVFLASNDYIEILDVIDSKNPKFVKRFYTGRNEKQIKINGDYIFSLDGIGQLGIWKIDTVNNLLEIGTVNITNASTDYITKFYFYKDYIFTIHSYNQDFDSSLRINKISNLLAGDDLDESRLSITGDLPDSTVINMNIFDNYIYLVKFNNNGGIKAYFETYKFSVNEDDDFNFTAIQTDYNVPIIAAQIIQETYIDEMYIDKDYVYRIYVGGVDIIDISNASQPTTTYSFSGTKFPTINVLAQDKLLYIFSRGTGVETDFSIYDISAYSQPICDNDVTGLIQDVPEEPVYTAWYQNIWNKIVIFFKDLFGFEVIASSSSPRGLIVKWCESDEIGNTFLVKKANTSTTDIVIDLKKPLKRDTDYAVILNNSIRDLRGVRIGQNPTNPDFKINWRFVTDDVDICEIEKTIINPLNYEIENDGIVTLIDPTEVFFTKTKATTTLESVAISINENREQQIQPVNGYRWDYIWEPVINEYVLITPTTTNLNIIQAHNQNGEADVLATANILEPNDYPPYKTGRTGETGSAHITVFLCENPWPPFGTNRYNEGGNKIFPYEDMEGNNDKFIFGVGTEEQGQFTGDTSDPADTGGYFNFKFYYCADQGLMGIEDDLPYLRPAVQSGRSSLIENSVCGDGLVTGDEECDFRDNIWMVANPIFGLPEVGLNPSILYCFGLVYEGITYDKGGVSCYSDTCKLNLSSCGFCGDGHVDRNILYAEECDDGATEDGDGCNRSCNVEDDYYCADEPSICGIDLGDGTFCVDTDGGDVPKKYGMATLYSYEGVKVWQDSDYCKPLEIVREYDCLIPGSNGGDFRCGDISPDGYVCQNGVCVEDTSICGDGEKTGLEECDDRGTEDGDGCDGYCRVEDGYYCANEPSICGIDLENGTFCVDVDGGNMPTIYGTTALYRYNGQEVWKHSDYCKGSDLLMEYDCLIPGTFSEPTSCAGIGSEFVCQEGACYGVGIISPTEGEEFTEGDSIPIQFRVPPNVPQNADKILIYLDGEHKELIIINTPDDRLVNLRYSDINSVDEHIWEIMVFYYIDGGATGKSVSYAVNFEIVPAETAMRESWLTRLREFIIPTANASENEPIQIEEKPSFISNLWNGIKDLFTKFTSIFESTKAESVDILAEGEVRLAAFNDDNLINGLKLEDPYDIYGLDGLLLVASNNDGGSLELINAKINSTDLKPFHYGYDYPISDVRGFDKQGGLNRFIVLTKDEITYFDHYTKQTDKYGNTYPDLKPFSYYGVSGFVNAVAFTRISNNSFIVLDRQVGKAHVVQANDSGGRIISSIDGLTFLQDVAYKDHKAYIVDYQNLKVYDLDDDYIFSADASQVLPSSGAGYLRGVEVVGSNVYVFGDALQQYSGHSYIWIYTINEESGDLDYTDSVNIGSDLTDYYLDSASGLAYFIYKGDVSSMDEDEWGSLKVYSMNDDVFEELAIMKGHHNLGNQRFFDASNIHVMDGFAYIISGNYTNIIDVSDIDNLSFVDYFENGEVPPVCGNGVIDMVRNCISDDITPSNCNAVQAVEYCDGSDFDGRDCASEVSVGSVGYLTCSDNCTINTSTCDIELTPIAEWDFEDCAFVSSTFDKQNDIGGVLYNAVRDVGYNKSGVYFNGEEYAEGSYIFTFLDHFVARENYVGSFCAWAKPEGFDGDFNVGVPRFLLSASSGKGLAMGVSEGKWFLSNGSTWNPELDIADLIDDWQHVCAVYGQTEASFYLNGILMDTFDRGGQINGEYLRIGGVSNTSLRKWKGWIDEVNIFSQAIDQEKVTELFEIVKNPGSCVCESVQDCAHGQFCENELCTDAESGCGDRLCDLDESFDDCPGDCYDPEKELLQVGVLNDSTTIRIKNFDVTEDGLRIIFDNKLEDSELSKKLIFINREGKSTFNYLTYTAVDLARLEAIMIFDMVDYRDIVVNNFYAGDEVYIEVLCGDGMVFGDEGCDDGDTENGNGCSADCQIEDGWECIGDYLSVCSFCGDGFLNGTEDCDKISDYRYDLVSPFDAQPVNASFGDEGYIVYGSWDCNGLEDNDTLFNKGVFTCNESTCEVDVSGCSVCGDGEKAGVEQCDGEQGCSSDCEWEIEFTCGNEVLDSPAEDCQGENLNGKLCVDIFTQHPGKKYTGGILSCYPAGDNRQCMFNTTGCYYCGDGVCNDDDEYWANCQEDCDAPDVIGKALKRIIFTAEGSEDAIGIQVFENPEHLTVSKWHQKNSEETGSLPMQSLVVDKYDAITDGNNIYIDALNYDLPVNNTTGTMYSNIYLFSRNLGARPEMLNVFEQVIKNVEFNANLTNYGYCGDDVLNPDHEITCVTDQDCPLSCEDNEFCDPDVTLDPPAIYPKVCSNQIDKLKRNYKRLRDLQEITNVLNSRQALNKLGAVDFWQFKELYNVDENQKMIFSIFGKNKLYCEDEGCPIITTETGSEFTTEIGAKFENSNNLYLEDDEGDGKFDFTNNFSIFSWVKPTLSEVTKIIVSKGDNFNYALDITADNALELAYYSDDNWFYLVSENNIVSINTWSFVGVIVGEDAPNTSSIKFYVGDQEYSVDKVWKYNGKGKPKKFKKDLNKYPLIKNNERLNVGDGFNGGLINSLIIFDRPVNVNEINQIKTQMRGEFGNYPSMSEGSYLTGNTLSVWDQSWSKLSSELGSSLPVDPINRLGLAGSCLHSSSSIWVFCQKDGDCNDESLGFEDEKYAHCTFHDPVTGWSAEDRRFSFACDSLRSYAYRYIAKPDNVLGYQIRTKFEDFGLDKWDESNKEDFLNAFRDPVRVYIDNVCDGDSGYDEISSMSTGFCGDGKLNLNLGEVCDPPGSTRRYEEGCYSSYLLGRRLNTYKEKICTNDCKAWDTSDYTCHNESFKLCGNGIIDEGENCDDGILLNGYYNQCSLLCKGKVPSYGEECNLLGPEEYATCYPKVGLSPGYCGDGHINPDHEICDPSEGLNGHEGFCVRGVYNGGTCDDNDDCQHSVEGESIGDSWCLIIDEFTTRYATDKEDSCSFDCQDRGFYCGDGIVQTEFGEECDGDIVDSANNCVKKCGEYCKKLNPAVFEGWFWGGNLVTLNSCPYPPLTPGEWEVTLADELLAGYDNLNVRDRWREYLSRSLRMSRATKIAIGTDCIDRWYQDCRYSEECNPYLAAVQPTVDLQNHCDDIHHLTPEECRMVDQIDATELTGTTLDDGEDWQCTPLDLVEVGNEPRCGNSIVDESLGEVCDEGTLHNGDGCELGDKDYCTYCSWDCKEVIDVYEIEPYDSNVDYFRDPDSTHSSLDFGWPGLFAD